MVEFTFAREAWDIVVSAYFVKVVTYCVLKPKHTHVFWYAVQIGIFCICKGENKKYKDPQKRDQILNFITCLCLKEIVL
jgi:hypothetical protein